MKRMLIATAVIIATMFVCMDTRAETKCEMYKRLAESPTSKYSTEWWDLFERRNCIAGTTKPIRSDWFYMETMDAMTDKVFPYIASRNNKYSSGAFQDVAYIYVGCRTINLRITGLFDNYRHDYTRVRFDNASAIEMQTFTRRVGDEDVLGFYTPSRLVPLLIKHNRIKIEVYLYPNDRRVMEFSLMGFTAMYNKMNCPSIESGEVSAG